MRAKHLTILSFALLAGLSSCKDDQTFEPPVIPVVPPATYDFENVSYEGQILRQDQLKEMILYLETAEQPQVSLDAQVLRDMFENTGGNGGGNFTFTSDKQLKDKCFAPHQARIDDYFEKAVQASLSLSEGSNGVAGRIQSAGGGSYRLFDENGWEYAEIIDKTIMGAVFYYQATSVYLGESKMDVDNIEVVAGEGTAMQHHWDEAYGYLGVTNDFPENTDDVRFWGNYCNGRDALLNTNETLSEAFRLGRQAILMDRLDVRDEAIADVRAEWERVVAGTAIHYLNTAMDNITDDYVRNHVLSEAYVFVECLFYNEERSISEADMNKVLGYIGINFYEVEMTGLLAARDLLAETYGMDGVKSSL